MTTSAFSPTWRDNTGVLHTAGPGSNDREKMRVAIVKTNRMYYDGSQYDEANEKHRIELGVEDGVPMPEHERKHASSIHISDSVEFIAFQLTDGFQIIAGRQEEKEERQPDGTTKKTKQIVPNTSLQEVIDAAVDSTALLHNFADEDIAVDNIMIDGAQAGDVPYETHWDPVKGTAYWEFWPSEWVEFDVPRGDYIRKVTRCQQIEITEMVDGVEQTRTVRERVVYDLVTGITQDFAENGIAEIVQECRRRVYYDADPEDEPQSVEFLGIPFIPWGVIRVNKEGLTGFRGDPLINRKARDNADRLNAVEQLAYRIARYNSHGNVAVAGDQAFLQVEKIGTVAKDVGDVLTFPGGTSVAGISLPTDAQMIEHVRRVTADAIFSSFGLVRVEPDTFANLGAITGYALEILNRKSEGKLKRVRRIFKTDFITMLHQMLDMTAYKQAGGATDDSEIEVFERNPETDPPVEEINRWWLIDPMQVFPDREVEIRMGTGYIVDDVSIRDDYTANLISREEALRQRGFSDDQIEKIIGEVTESQQQQSEGALLARTGQTLEEAAQEREFQRQLAIRPTGTTAGSATGSTARK